MSQYHTIPRRFSHHEARHFAGGKSDRAVPCGDASKLYELNVWAMTCGRAKERTVSIQDELAAKTRYVFFGPATPKLLGLTHTCAGDIVVAGRTRSAAAVAPARKPPHCLKVSVARVVEPMTI